MSLLLKSLSGLETIPMEGLESSQRVTLITAGGFKNVTWGSLFNAISDPLVSRLNILEDAIEDLTSGGGGATIWPIARTITLTGAVTGSVAMDGSQNVSMATTIADGSLSLAKVNGLSTRLDTLDGQVTKFWGTGYTAGPQPSNFGANADLITGATWLQAVQGTATNIPNEGTGNFSLLTNGPTNYGNQMALRNGEMWIRGQSLGVWSSWNKLWTSANLNPSNLLLKTDVASSATKLATARAFSLTGVVTATGANFDGTGNVALTTAIADSALTIAKTSGLQAALDLKYEEKTAVIGAGVSLNTITASGYYRQDVSGQVTTASMYPQAGATGILTVFKNSAFIVQDYVTTSNQRYRRVYNGASWSAWTKQWDAGDFDPSTKLDKSGGTITGTLTVTQALQGYNTVGGTYFLASHEASEDPAWLFITNSGFKQRGIDHSNTGLSLVNLGGGVDGRLTLRDDGGITYNDHAIYHAGFFDPANPVSAGGLLNIGDPGGTHLRFRNDGKYSVNGGSTWRDLNEAPQTVTDPRYNTLMIGADSDLLLYESATNEMSVRVGPSGAYKYFAFNANGNFSVPNGRVMISGNEAWHAGNFDPATKLGVSATAAAATKLATARTINGVAFDGTANISIAASIPDGPTFTGTVLFDVNGASTGKARFVAGDGVAANGVHLDAINDTGSTFAPLNFRGTTVTINGNTPWTNANFDPNSKLGARASLGVAANTVSDWNNALDNGWHMGTGAANAPAAIGSSWFMVRVSQHNGDWITQEGWVFTDNADSIVYRRRKLNGTWSAWTTDLRMGALYATQNGTSAVYADGPANTQYGGYALTWGGTRQYQLGMDSDGTLRLWAYTAAGAFSSTAMVMSRTGHVTFGAALGSDDFTKMTVQGGIKSRGGAATLAVDERDNTSAEWNIYASGSRLRFWRNGQGDRMWIGAGGDFGADRIVCGYDPGVGGSIGASNWFRSTGQTGIYFADYTGGWYMTDTTYVRTYNNKPVAAADYVISSDARLKTETGPLVFKRRLRPVRFFWNDSGEEDFGFFAQEVEEDYPELVGEIEAKTGSMAGQMIKQLSYQRATAVLAAQSNHQGDEIEVLKQQNAEQAGQLAEMRSELDALKQLVADLRSQ